MKQLQTTLNGKEILLVEVPEDATCAIELTYGGDKIVCWYDCGFSEIEIKTPGNWKLLGLCSEIKEEVAEMIVDYWTEDAEGQITHWTEFKNYQTNDFMAITAVESLHSFVKSHHFNPETTVILIKE